MASVAQLRAKLTFDDAQFNQGIKRSTDKAAKFAGQMRSFLASGAIVSGVRNIANEFDRIGKLGKRFDVAPEALQKIGTAAKLAGTDIETVARGMNALTVNTAEALKGSATYADAFEQLNIDLAEFAKLNADGKVLALSKAIASATDVQAANAAAMRILGTRAGAELLPMLRDHASLVKTISETPVVSKAQIEAIEQFNDSITKMQTALTAAAGSALGGFLEKLEAIRTALTATVDIIGPFIRTSVQTGSISEGVKSAERAVEQAEEPPQNILDGLRSAIKTLPIIGQPLARFGDALAERSFGRDFTQAMLTPVPPAPPAPAAPSTQDRSAEMIEKLGSIDRAIREQSETSF